MFYGLYNFVKAKTYYYFNRWAAPKNVLKQKTVDGKYTFHFTSVLLLK